MPKPATTKSQSLLAYLILHRERSHSRERLAALFWSNRPDRRARRSLTTALWHIRRCLPDQAVILSNAHSVQFDPQVDLWLDTEVFERQASAGDLASLESAAAMYRGDFLEDYYDDWIITERYRLAALLAGLLAELAVAYEIAGDFQAVIGASTRLLAQDELREDAHRMAMQAYCHLGQRNAALEQYRHCREVVLRELGTEPMGETTELYQAILDGRFERRHSAGVRASTSPRLQAAYTESRSRARVAPGRLAGREQELACLEGHWRQAEAGQGALVLVSGEAGVGKTRLIQELADPLPWQGGRVLWGRCYEFERVLPYQPITEVLRDAGSALASAGLAKLPGWVVNEVARLVPELLDATRTIGRVQEPTRLFEGVCRFLAELSQQGPILIILDDLHWASQSTLQLVHYLVRHLTGNRVLLIGTYRPEAIAQGHVLFDLERRLVREGLAEKLSLPRLPPDAVESLILEMSGAGQAVLPLAERLYRETEGNPFFLVQIVSSLFEIGLIELREGAWHGDWRRISSAGLPVPRGVQEAIQGRVCRLSDSAQQALRLAAVLGREFDFDVLNAAWRADEEATLEALDDLLRHQLVEEGSGVLGRDYAFSHHKIQEVVYGALAQRRRQHAHARIGAVMERIYGDQVESVAGELAFHFRHGRGLDESLTDKAITYLLLAGDRARELYAHREAIDHYRQALDLLQEERAHDQAARTFMKLGLTYHTASDWEQARQAYEEGFALWQRITEEAPTAPLLPSPHPLRVALPGLVTLDHTVSFDVTSGVPVLQLYQGLVELGPEGEVVPAVAKSWDVSRGGRTYLFRLGDDARWSDGEAVTAHDFCFAWKRMLAPATGAVLAPLLHDIKGARAFHQGDVSDPNSIGVRALDDFTLAVELEGPTPYFLQVLPWLFPLPLHVQQLTGDAWAEPDQLVSNGPFRLVTWQHGTSMVLARNALYCGRFPGNLERIELSLGVDRSTQLALYQAGMLDVLDLSPLPPAEMDRARQQHAGDYVSGPNLTTRYLGFDVSRPPFDDPRVRRALILATDKEQLAEVTLRGSLAPATGGLVPPGMPGHSPGIGLPYDPDQAQDLLDRAGYPGGHGLPTITMMTGKTLSFQAASLMVAWREKLGIEVSCQFETVGELWDRLLVDPPPLFLAGWVVEHPDPDSFLRVCPARRCTRWRHQNYEQLVDQARREEDPAVRIDLYRQADSILVQEAAIAPLFYGRLHLLVKPWVAKYPVSALHSWYWKDAVIEPH